LKEEKLNTNSTKVEHKKFSFIIINNEVFKNIMFWNDNDIRKLTFGEDDL